MPETVRATVWLPLTALDAVAVTVMAVAAVSLPELALTERLTVGKLRVVNEATVV